MREEERLLSGVLFCPGDQELRRIKLRAHNLCTQYNRTFEARNQAGRGEQLPPVDGYAL